MLVLRSLALFGADSDSAPNATAADSMYADSDDVVPLPEFTDSDYEDNEDVVELLRGTRTLYQRQYDSIGLRWNATDVTSDVANVTWMAGSLPGVDDWHPETGTIDDQVWGKALVLFSTKSCLSLLSVLCFLSLIITSAISIPVLSPVSSSLLTSLLFLYLFISSLSTLFTLLPLSVNATVLNVFYSFQIPLNAISMSPGQTLLFTVQAEDFAGNRITVTSPPLTIDTTPPLISGLTCSPRYLSRARSQLSCEWETTLDEESPVDRVVIGELMGIEGVVEKIG